MKPDILQMGGDLAALRNAAERVSRLVVNCRDCSTCCTSGLVYVLPEEYARLAALNVPMVTIEGVHFIERARGGACPMLGKSNGKCTIYGERPLCCRLYPLDILSRNKEVEWALYHYCPLPRKQEAVMVLNNTGRMNHGLVLQALQMIEDIFGPERIDYLAKEDLVASRIELLDEHRRDYSILGPVSTKADLTEEVA